MISFISVFFSYFVKKFVAIGESRKDGGKYWKMNTRDHQMPKKFKALLNQNFEIQSEKILKTKEQILEGSKHDCEKSLVKNTHTTILEDFEPISSVPIYRNDDIYAKEENKVVKNFEPRPNVSAYGDNDVDAKPKKNRLLLETLVS